MFIPFISSFKITLSSKLPVYYFSQVIMPSSCTPSCSPSFTHYYYYYCYYCCCCCYCYYYYYSFFCSWFNTIQQWGLFLKPEATARDIFYILLLLLFLLCCFFRFLGFYFALICFVVAYIDNAFLSMCAVLASTIFCISARFCLAGIFSRCFSVPFFTNRNAPTTIWIIVVFNCHILSTSI